MILINGKPLEVDNIFSGGELNIRLPDLDLKVGDEVVISYRSKDPNDIFKLGLIISALRDNWGWANPKISVDMHYLPYARQDRVCKFKEPFSLKFVIEYLKFLDIPIFVTDVHSEEAGKLVRQQSAKITFYDFIGSNPFIRGLIESDLTDLNFDNRLVKIAPDKGAKDRVRKYVQSYSTRDISNVDNIPQHIVRYNKFAKIYNRAPTLVANKTRSDGKVIQELEIPEDLSLEKKDILIVDDICDGGATFIELAKIIKPMNPRSMTLFVTHGIFRNGTDCLFEAGFDRVITTDSLPQIQQNHKGEFHVFKI